MSGKSTIRPASVKRNQITLSGSNYFFYSLGSFGTLFNHPPDKPWANATNITAWNDCWYSLNHYAPAQGPQLVIQNIHHLEVLEMVRSQLAAMRSEGQSAITIPIWLADPINGSIDHHSGHVFDWNGLTVQQKTNLLTLTSEICDAGFLKITYRFNNNGLADPRQWTAFQPDSFQKCSQFVMDTIALLRQSLLARFGACNNRWSFDLGGELGGSTLGQSAAYTARLMKNYIGGGFSIDETCGFSMVCSGKNIAQSFQNQFTTLSALGAAHVPKSWAISCYSRSNLGTNILEGLTSLAQAMRQNGCQDQPVVIIECLNNDAAEASEINLAIDLNPTLKITELYQWPLSRAALDNGVWTVDSACADAFAHYRNIGRSTSPGTFNFEKSAVIAKENGQPGGRVMLNVLRSGGAVGQVHVPFTTANGTAKAGQDYVTSSGTLTFSEGQSSAAISIVILNDNLVEGPETFTVSLGNPFNQAASLGPVATATLTIISDESVPPPSRAIGGQTIISKGMLTGVKINFSYDLEPNSTTNLNSYKLYAAGRDGLFHTADDTHLPLSKATYDRTRKIVTLTCKPCKLNSNAQLEISGTGSSSLLDTYKRPIDGDNNSTPGGDALILIHKNGSVSF